MATKNPFQDIRVRAGDSQKSVQWYQKQIKQLGSLTSDKLLSSGGSLVSEIRPGQMYMFLYEAKLKDKLPYWDAFPLVLPFRIVKDGFFGINLHYLPYMARFALLGSLSDFTSDSKMDDNTRLLLSWKILTSSSKLNMIKPCVKHYLSEQIQSRFLKINFPDWVTASQLPVEQFQNASKSQVWRESKTRY